MTLGPLNNTTGYTRVLIDLRSQILDLQRQLGTGQKSQTYGGLGVDSFTALSVNQRSERIAGYRTTMDLVSIRLSIVDQSLGRLSGIVQELKSDAFTSTYDPQGNGQTIEQANATLRLDEAVAMFNTQADERYVFGGRAIDRRPAESAAIILDGDAGRAGLRTLIAERKAADIGTGNLGRLTTTTTASALTVSEDGVHGFGLKLVAASTSTAGAVTAGPTGSPPSVSIDLGVNQPVEGDTFRFGFSLPDGSDTEIELTAVTGTPEEGEFEIGATVAGTIANLETAVQTAIEDEVITAVASASAITASGEFFAGTASSPPVRVDGPPYETATAQIAGTATNTVVWYQGEDSATDPRLAASATIDEGLKVNYGLRANEPGFVWMLQHLGAYAAESYSPANAEDERRYREMTDRVGQALNYPVGVQTIDQIRIDIGVGQARIEQAGERHDSDLAFLDELKNKVQGVDNNQLAVELLTIQTRLEASYQATARIADLTLTNYIR